MAIHKIGLIHTSAALVPVFQKLFQDRLPTIETFNIADDSLVKEMLAQGQMTANVARRVAAQIANAEQAGAEFVLVTCSSIGAAAEAAAPFTGVPVMRIDQPMADRAVAIGSRIGVIATLPSTLKPTADLIQRRAAAASRAVNITMRLCEGAFDALSRGDTSKHDELIRDTILDLSGQVDSIVLAQASMARVADQLPTGSIPIPILSSPSLAMDYLAKLLSPEPGY